MIRTSIALATCIGLSACGAVTDFRSTLGNRTTAPVAAPAPVVAPQVMTAKERLLSAIEGQGCQLNASNVGAVLSAAVITREELLQLTPQLQSEGRVEVSGSGTIRSTSATCI